MPEWTECKLPGCQGGEVADGSAGWLGTKRYRAAGGSACPSQSGVQVNTASWLSRHSPVSCDRRLSVSITVMSGEDTLSSASASGTARLRAGECSGNVPREALSRYGWVAGGHVPPSQTKASKTHHQPPVLTAQRARHTAAGAPALGAPSGRPAPRSWPAGPGPAPPLQGSVGKRKLLCWVNLIESCSYPGQRAQPSTATAGSGARRCLQRLARGHIHTWSPLATVVHRHRQACLTGVASSTLLPPPSRCARRTAPAAAAPAGQAGRGEQQRGSSSSTRERRH